MLKNAKAKRSGEILPILKVQNERLDQHSQHISDAFSRDGGQSIFALGRQAANRVVLLSGTPALSRPSELFTQLKVLAHVAQGLDARTHALPFVHTKQNTKQTWRNIKPDGFAGCTTRRVSELHGICHAVLRREDGL
jgi:hypothetical protein